MRFLCIFFFINIFLLIDSYVLREEVNSRKCDINFNKSVLNIKFEENFCNNLEYSKYNLFKFNNCYNLKKTIIEGIELWSKNNNNIKYILDHNNNNNNNNNNNKNKNKIDTIISFRNLNEPKIGAAYRECNIELIKSHIYLNKNKCFYPDNFFCLYKNSIYILLFASFILIHFIIQLVILYIFNNNSSKYLEEIINLEEIERIENIEHRYYICNILPCFIINTVLLIYIHINCTKCISIKNVIAHEIGHILGFDHPDQHKSMNWVGYLNNCVVEKKINNNYDIESIMISTSNFLRFNKGISYNDKLGLYDLYPNCNYNNLERGMYENVYDNFEYIHNDNYDIILLIIFYLGLSITIPILIFSFLAIYKIYKRNITVNSLAE